MSFSTEIEDLEQFIDSYVGPDSRTSSSDWARTHSYEENQSFASVNLKPHEKLTARNDTGTEYWGKQPEGQQWQSPSQNREFHQQWNEHRPKIQERQVPQWQPPTSNFPEYQHQQQQAPLSYTDNPWEGNPALQQQMVAQSQGQGPHDIQAIVSDLIRQNNMNKVSQPSQFPPWVDITRPPPPLQGQMNQFEYHNEPYVNPMDLQSREPILHSMTFQRSMNDAMYPTQQSPVHFAQRTATPEGQPGQEWVHPNQNIYYQPQMTDPRGSPAAFPPQIQEQMPLYEQQQQYMMQRADRTHVQAPPQLQNVSHEIPGQSMHEAALLRQQEFTDRNYTHPAMTHNHTPSQPVTQPADHGVMSTAERIPKQLAGHVQSNNNQADTTNRPVETVTPNAKQPLGRKSSNEKYPNSKIRLSNESRNASDSSDRQPVERSNSEVFENESDDRWKTHNFKVYVNSKKNTRRTSSAADEDPDWRRRESGDSNQSRHNASLSESDRRHSSSDNDRKTQRMTDTTPPKHGDQKQKDKKQAQRKKRTDSEQSENDGHRRVAAKGKNTVHSWLENGSNFGDTEQELRRLHISDSETDLTKFIETTQAFATNEAKMREVAEILCNKALKNPKFARNASILCDRMSWMMVHGTKFRTVVLNVMQGHFKNREQLFSATFRSDTRWFGFASFMVEIFLNVRTSTKDRLIVLNEPVFQCLLQVLQSDQVTKEHVECFGSLFARAGPALEKENPSRMNELLSEIRDRCVISKTSHIRRVLLNCVELYATKWRTVVK
uniref:CBP80/20-dependent translation initiation factor n=1 Tax=Phallusia mammillata TaxID=59560 RepID=A0A6F9DAA1_9ASCI|nr:CBP80/20-dependent translation initiation factor [Phallusia mammillata]